MTTKTSKRCVCFDRHLSWRQAHQGGTGLASWSRPAFHRQGAPLPMGVDILSGCRVGTIDLRLRKNCHPRIK